MILLQLLGRRGGPHGDGCLGRMARPSDEAICRRCNRPRRLPVFTGLPLTLGPVEGIHHRTFGSMGEAHPIRQAVRL